MNTSLLTVYIVSFHKKNHAAQEKEKGRAQVCARERRRKRESLQVHERARDTRIERKRMRKRESPMIDERRAVSEVILLIKNSFVR